MADKPTPGTAKAVEAIVGDKAKVIGLVAIENNGCDALGRVIGVNGIKWVLR